MQLNNSFFKTRTFLWRFFFSDLPPLSTLLLNLLYLLAFYFFVKTLAQPNTFSCCTALAIGGQSPIHHTSTLVEILFKSVSYRQANTVNMSLVFIILDSYTHSPIYLHPHPIRILWLFLTLQGKDKEDLPTAMSVTNIHFGEDQVLWWFVLCLQCLICWQVTHRTWLIPPHWGWEKITFWCTVQNQLAVNWFTAFWT